MKVVLLHLNAANKPSLIFESGTKTRIIIHPAGENLTTWHTHDLSDSTYGNSSERQSRSRSRSHLSRVHIFHAITLWAIHGSPYTIPIYITVGMMVYHPTQRPSVLLSLWDPITLTCISTYSMHANQGPTNAVLNRLRWGLPPLELWTWKYTTICPSHPVFSTFP
jgi:hypothetical protein